MHTPVLLKEVLESLALNPSATVIDATLGSGGYFQAIRRVLNEQGVMLGIDVDPEAIAEVKDHLEHNSQEVPQTHLVVGNFRAIDDIAKGVGIVSADGIVADLGWRAEQFLSDGVRGRGFSFNADEPLLMTLGDPKAYPFLASDIVNTWNEEDIVNVLRAYGEERYAGRIARKIVSRRAVAPIQTARELGALIHEAVPLRYRYGRIHPATKTFQALRIAVNDECDALSEFVRKSHSLLASGGRLSIVSFHSIEDRIVKRTFRQLVSTENAIHITKKPIVPTDTELSDNPRARSAKLRTIEKI